LPIPIEVIFKVPVIDHIDISTDGKVVLYSTNVTGIPQLYRLDVKAGGKPEQITSGNDAVTFGYLSPSGDKILYLKDRDGDELHHLFVASKEGGKVEQITEKACRTFDAAWHPNGEEVVRTYTTKESSGLEICNLKTGENFIFKKQQIPCFAAKYSHDGKWVAYTEYGGGKDPKNTQITAAKRDDPADTISYKFKDGSREQLATWAPNDRKLAFLSDANSKTQVVIQQFPGEEHSFLELKEGEEAVESGARYEEAEIGWSPKGDEVYYAVSKHSRTTIYGHPLNGEKTRLPFPTGTVCLARFSADGKKAVAAHSSMESPYCIYLHEIGSKTATPLTSRDYGANLKELSTPESIWYKSSDGLDIHAWYLPAAKDKPPHPAVVWSHGGPSVQVFDAWNPYLQSISQSGFAVLAPNFRGSSGYGARFLDMKISDVGGGDLEDVVAGAEWLRRRPEVDKSKIAIMGGSYGGFMTLMALTKKPGVFSAGVAIAPVTDWSEMYKSSDNVYRKVLEEIFEGPPDKRGELYRNRSPVTHISQIKAPVLVTCGRKDSRTPIQVVEKFVQKLQELHHPYEFRVQEKEGHGFARTEAAIQEVRTAMEYLKKTLQQERKNTAS
jgi:dipeptidyl aminopeptidase/acylaminoacyl peptidase